jgi:V/A-type H+-transporting ATPase subunit I
MIRIRPTEARWFETYVPREYTVQATELLAATGMVQLELDPRTPAPVDTGKLRYFIERFQRLKQAHLEDLPTGQCRPTALVGDPLHMANLALHQLRTWSARVAYLREHLAQLESDLSELSLLTEGLEALHAAGFDLDGLPLHTQFLRKSLFACPKEACVDPACPDSVVKVKAVGTEHDFVLLIGEPAQADPVARLVVERQCFALDFPAWLGLERREHPAAIAYRRRVTESAIAESERELTELRHDPLIAESCANIETLAWYLEHSARHLGEQQLCHVTGWTTARDPDLLQRTLQSAGIQAMIRFPDAPPFARAPVTTLESWWAQPFRPLVLMWGPPGREEIDPSGVLALVVPLLFGYMFADVGHGLVLTIFALLFGRRWPQVRFLLPCGLSAMLFGVAVGDVFGRGDLIPTLWLKPLEAPLTILAVPLLVGVALMLLGLVFAGVEARWRGRLREWLLVDAAVLTLYTLLLLAPFFPAVLWLVPLALAHYFGGAFLRDRERPLSAMATAVGQLLLSLFELAMNTLSFVRVGAFALAHSALGQAVVTLADTVEHPLGWFLVLALGNLFVILLEGLVVFVQTTRLVLFEFFIRFLRADGRIFEPLTKPPASLSGAGRVGRRGRRRP